MPAAICAAISIICDSCSDRPIPAAFHICQQRVMVGWNLTALSANLGEYTELK